MVSSGTVQTGNSDTELVAAVRTGGIAGDRAYAELLDRHRGAIWQSIGGLFAPGETWEDLFAAAMVGLWEACLDWDGRQPFYQWARFVASRKVITLVKTSTRAKHTPLRGFESLGPGQETTWGGGMAEIEAEDSLRAILGELTPLERSVLVLRLDGWSYEQIAERVGGNYRRVDNAFQRACRKARAAVSSPASGVAGTTP